MEKPLLIIIEGIDGTFKSTVCEKLSKKLNLPVEHHGPVKDLEAGKKEYFDFVNNCNYAVIKDRFAMGERTYSLIYRGYKADYMKELEDALQEKFDVFLFYLTAEDEFIKRNLEKRGEDFLKMEDLKHIHSLCDEYYKESTILQKYKLDAEVGSDLLTEIIIFKIFKKISLECEAENLIKKMKGIE